MPAGRLPDFLVIGAMKAGTTSLHVWLDAQPEIWASPRKEPHFFSQDWVWSRGLDWYQQLFADAPLGALVGESSTSYTDPKYTDLAAMRMREVVPAARLVYVVRDPIERLRSDYRHMVREGRLHVPITEAVSHPMSGIVAKSMYFQCLAPYRTAFPPEQLLVVTFESLFGADEVGWHAVLQHLGLAPRPAPGTRHNAAEEQVHLPGVKRLLRRAHLLQLAKRMPGRAKHLTARLASTDPRRNALLASAGAELPHAVTARIWADVASLEEWLGTGSPLWERKMDVP